MSRVVVTHALPVDLRPWLGSEHDVLAPRVGGMGRAELLGAIADAEALICMLTDRIDEELLACAPRLRVVANHAVGVDNVDVAAATRRRIVVANTPFVLTEATADLAFALLLAVARRVVEADRFIRSGRWNGWEPGQLLGADVHGRTLGLIGFGRIGQAVARRARGFDMTVLYAAPRRAPAAVEAVLAARHVSLFELLEQSDFVSLHCPLTEATRGLLDRDALARMKPTAYLVNTARGPIVDEDALADALESGRLAGAALDVFAQEPRVSTRLLSSPRVVLAPHIGSATLSTRSRMAELCARAVRAVLEGERPPNVVNPEVFD